MQKLVLSKLEFDVFRLIERNMKVWEIMKTLQISHYKYSCCVKNVIKKTGCDSKIQALARVENANIIFE